MATIKKLYVAVASIIAAEYANAANLSTVQRFAVRKSVARMAEEFAREFQADNPRFDQDQFFEACGIVR